MWIRILRIAGLALICVAVAGMTAWGVLALYYAAIESHAVRATLAATFGVLGAGTVGMCAFSRWRWRALGGFFLCFALLVAAWNTIAPSNDRDWQPDVAVLPYATVDGDLVSVHNIRNFDYRSATDYTPVYYDQTFDVRELSGVDLFAVYWMGPAIAHTFVSFEFGGGKHLAVSIETRKERGEGYSTLKGFFKQYELYYVVADERDVVRLRTNYRSPTEEVYLYRVHAPVENGRRLFLEYIRRINALKEMPAFYNTLIHNCTTMIWLNSRVNPDHVPFSWKLLVSGYVPDYLYTVGRLDTREPFSELRRRGLVNARALAADADAEFSRRIREGLASHEN